MKKKILTTTMLISSLLLLFICFQNCSNTSFHADTSSTNFDSPIVNNENHDIAGVNRGAILTLSSSLLAVSAAGPIILTAEVVNRPKEFKIYFYEENNLLGYVSNDPLAMNVQFSSSAQNGIHKYKAVLVDGNGVPLITSLVTSVTVSILDSGTGSGSSPDGGSSGGSSTGPTPVTSNTGKIWATGGCGRIEYSVDHGASFIPVEALNVIGKSTPYLVQNFQGAECIGAHVPSPSFQGLVYHKGRLIVSDLGAAGTKLYFYSDDNGVTWNQVNSINYNFWNISSNGSELVNSDIGTGLNKSSDGITWYHVSDTDNNGGSLFKFRSIELIGNFFLVGGDGGNYTSKPYISISNDSNLNTTDYVIDNSTATNYLGSKSIGSYDQLTLTVHNSMFAVSSGGTDSIIVLSGSTGVSSVIHNLPHSPLVYFVANDMIFMAADDSKIYRMDFTCSSICSVNLVQVGTIANGVQIGGTAVYNSISSTEGYLVGVRYWNNSAYNSTNLVLRSTTTFKTNSTTNNIIMDKAAYPSGYVPPSDSNIIRIINTQ